MRSLPDLVHELKQLLGAFDEAGVEYALCGGLAANIYGADRFTKDIDVLVAPSGLDRALEVARGCGFDIDSGELPLLDGTRSMRRVVKLEEGWEEPLMLDLMIADGGTYAAAFASRYPVEQEEGQLWLVSREELVSMKREANRPIDLQDIERIR